MAAKSAVAKNQEMYFLFSLDRWEIYEIPRDVYLEFKEMEVSFLPAEKDAHWVSPEVREEVEKWVL